MKQNKQRIEFLEKKFKILVTIVSIIGSVSTGLFIFFFIAFNTQFQINDLLYDNDIRIIEGMENYAHLVDKANVMVQALYAERQGLAKIDIEGDNIKINMTNGRGRR